MNCEIVTIFYYDTASCLTLLQIINQENGGGKYFYLILPWRLIMMSPAPASVIGAGIGICTFCTE